jgi:DNA-binding NtrC family response regulator
MNARSTNRIETSPFARSARLRILYGADSGAEVAIPAVGLTIGADRAADVVLKDEAVSRKHMTVRASGSGFEVTDLGSRNGTFLDNVSIQKATVPVGAILRVGATLLQLVPAEDAMPIPPSASTSFGAMIGSSVAMRQIYAILERASRSNAPILLLGESGTGKELAARAVHDASPRKDGPFVVFDCGASSENLIESDLFGHKKGAFTGAQEDRTGAFERAHGGTLFLDEIGDLPLGLQPKLLRMLESGEAMALGGKGHARFDVRIVAATHHDLTDSVARGVFRGDLYYRLAVVEVHVPPLRQRVDDLELLVDGFLRREGHASANDPAALRGKNLDRLRAYAWPGNVRELRNVIARAIALSAPATPFAEMPVLLAGNGAPPDAPTIRADKPYHDAKADLLARFERDYLADLLARANGNVSQAARDAGVGRKLLYAMLARTGLGAVAGEAPQDDDE